MNRWSRRCARTLLLVATMPVLGCPPEPASPTEPPAAEPPAAEPRSTERTLALDTGSISVSNEPLLTLRDGAIPDEHLAGNLILPLRQALASEPPTARLQASGAASPATLQQLLYTLHQSRVDEVHFSIAGEPLELSLAPPTTSGCGVLTVEAETELRLRSASGKDLLGAPLSEGSLPEARANVPTLLQPCSAPGCRPWLLVDLCSQLPLDAYRPALALARSLNAWVGWVCSTSPASPQEEPEGLSCLCSLRCSPSRRPSPGEILDLVGGPRAGHRDSSRLEPLERPHDR